MKAVYILMGYSEKDFFVYGLKNILPARLKMAKKYLQIFSRKFKNKPVLIGGSFLHNKEFNDIDIFVISKYEKDDYKEGKFHINYLAEEAYGSLFFASLQKSCISNRKIDEVNITEKVNLDTFLSLYQELGNDLDRKFVGVEKTLREFIMQRAHLTQRNLPDSAELRREVKGVLKTKKPLQLIKNMVIETILLGVRTETALHSIKELLSSYQEIIKEYPQHENYYKEMMEPLKEVAALAS